MGLWDWQQDLIELLEGVSAIREGSHRRREGGDWKLGPAWLSGLLLTGLTEERKRGSSGRREQVYWAGKQQPLDLSYWL